MRTASPRFVDSLGKTNRWVTRVLWSNNGSTWSDANFVSGSVTRSLTDDIHWTASLELSGDNATLTGINSYNTRIRIHHGIMFGPGDIETLAFGTFRVTSNSFDEEQKTISVDLESYESFVIQAQFQKPTNINTGSADSVLKFVLGGVNWGPDAFSLYWDENIKSKYGTIIPGSLVDQDRWAVIDGDDNSIADAISGRIITDPDGGFVVKAVPTLQDKPVLAINKGELLINHSVEYSSEDVTNVVVATGTSVDGVSIGPAIIKDTDRLSVTYFARPISEGGFGEAPYFLNSSRIGSEAQCIEVARSKLAARLGLKQTVSWSGVHNPLVEPGDVITVDGIRVILDAVTYDLNGGELSADTRTQSADLLGNVWEPPVEDADDSDTGDES